MIERGKGRGARGKRAWNFPLTPCLLPLLFVAIAAQEPAPPAQLEPFRTEVNYIRVDMYPTADGKPVTDLRQDEIEILDEGAPQKIDRFEHVLVRGTRSQEIRREPSTVAEMREATQDVRVRARTGYLAATRGDESKAKAAATAVAAAKPVDARAEAVKGSLSTLGIFSRERPLRIHVASGYLPSGAATIWAVAEVPAATGARLD